MSAILNNWEYMISGLRYTFALALIGIVGSFLLGCILATLRLSPYLPVRLATKAFIELVRSVPLLLFIFFTYFLITELGYNVTAFMSGSIALAVFTSVYVAEIIRSGIPGVHPGHVEAARASGLSYLQTMRHVVLPQAVRRMMPSLSSEFIMLIKETSLVSVIGVQEFYTRVSITNARVLVHPFELLAFAAVVYFCICFVLSLVARRYELRSDI